MQVRGLNALATTAANVWLYLNVHAVRSKREEKAGTSWLQVLSNMQHCKSLPVSNAAATQREQGGGKVPDASDNCMPVMTKLHRG